MRRKEFTSVLAAALLTAGAAATTLPPAYAAGGPSGATVALGVNAGTLGVGPELDLGAGRQAVLRLALNAFNLTRSQSQNSVEYQGAAKLQSFAALIDLAPRPRSGLHLTAGYVDNNTVVDAHGQPGPGGFTFDGVTYTAAETGIVSGRASFPKGALYVGVGAGSRALPRGKVGITLDVGALLGQKPEFRLSAQNAALDPTLQQSVNAQQATTQHDLGRLSVYPVIQLGVAVGL